MSQIFTNEGDLRKLFAADVEGVFQIELGVADPLLLDYIIELLMRFVRMEAVLPIRNTEGRRLEEVAEMLIEAEERTAKPRREIYRHIGDYALFTAGVYPESLRALQKPSRRDHLLDYIEQGKRGYSIASTYGKDPFKEEAPILRRLSHDFELCTYGLNRVRTAWGKEVVKGNGSIFDYN